MIALSERIRAEARMVIGDRIVEPGEVVTVDSVSAQTLVNSGRASFATPIRALRPDVLAGNRVLSVGEVGHVGEGRAVQLAREGAVELVEPEALSESARSELGKALPAKPVPIPDPFEGMQIVAVKALMDGTLLGNRVAAKGEAVDLPESLACLKIRDGQAELAEGASLSSKGKAYLRAWKIKRLGADDPVY